MQRQPPGITSYLLTLVLWSVCTVGIVLCFADLAQAQIEANTEDTPLIDEKVGVTLRAPFVAERWFETDIDDGGEVAEWRLSTGIRPRFQLSPQWRAGLPVGYTYNHYDFSGNTGFGALNPWEHLHFIRVATPLTYIHSEKWRFAVSPLFLISAESGADLSESISAGGFVGARYSFSDNFALGLAVGARTQIEDDPKLLLFPLIRWKFRLFGGRGDGSGSSSRGLTLISFSGPTRGSGGELRYDWGSNWIV